MLSSFFNNLTVKLVPKASSCRQVQVLTGQTDSPFNHLSTSKCVKEKHKY